MTGSSRPPLRVLIDGALIGKSRGLGRYTYELVYALAKFPAGSHITVAIPATVERELPRADHVEYLRRPALPLPVWEQFLLPAIARRSRYDVVHCPYNTKPLALSVGSLPHVVTLHDVIFMGQSGGSTYQRLGNAYRRAIVRVMFRGRMQLVTVSHASAEAIRSEFGVLPRVVYTSVDSFADREGGTAMPTAARYLVHIGGISPHKNTQRLIDAFNAANLAEVGLIVLGVAADTEMARRNASARVSFPGHLPDDQVVQLIRGALGMFLVSFEEGYGLPVVEAMASGCPVVTSNRPPMTELAADAALFVDPGSEREITAACRAVSSDGRLRDKLVRAARERARAFTAEAMAVAMHDVYRRASAL